MFTLEKKDVNFRYPVSKILAKTLGEITISWVIRAFPPMSDLAILPAAHKQHITLRGDVTQSKISGLIKYSHKDLISKVT